MAKDTMVKKTINAPNVGVDVEVEIFDKDGKKIISHNSIQRAIHWLQKEGHPIHYSTNIIKAELFHAVAMCNMQCGDVAVQEVGESMENTLVDEISRNHPVLIASQRAFDRAAIRALGFEGKVYSNLEIPLNDTVVEDVVEDVTEVVEEVVAYEDVEEIVDSDDSGYIVVEDETEAVPTAAGIISSSVTDDDEIDVGLALPSLEDYTESVIEQDETGNATLSFGQHKGKTLSEIYNSVIAGKKGSEYLFWVATAYTPYGNTQKDKDAVIAFINASEERKQALEKYKANQK